MSRRTKAGTALVAGMLGVGAAIAIAAVPDGGGVFHACYTSAVGGGTIPASGANIRLIDPGAGQQCDPASNEHAFTFNQQGQPGAQGLPGEQGPPGTSTITTVGTPENAGHAALTFAGGRTRSLNGTTLQLDVLSVGYGVTGPGAKGSGYATKGSPAPLVRVTRPIDKYSPTLSKACAAGTHLSKVVVTLYGGKVKFTLTTALITSVQFVGSQGGGAQHLEELDEFAAEKITTEYQSGGSSLLPALKYNAKTAAKV
jgi:type VI protein secretion system component Hcp